MVWCLDCFGFEIIQGSVCFSKVKVQGPFFAITENQGCEMEIFQSHHKDSICQVLSIQGPKFDIFKNLKLSGDQNRQI